MQAMQTESIFAKVRAEYEAERRKRAAELGLTLEEYEGKREQEREAEEQRRREEDRRAWQEQRRREDHQRFFKAARVLLPKREDRIAILEKQVSDTAAARVAKQWVESERPVLVLCGPAGVGKTFAAVLAMYELGQFNPVVVRAIDLPKAVDPWKHERDDEWNPIDLYAAGLVLDDLGSERSDPRFAEALFRLVDARQDPQTRTVITTNMAKGEFRDRYDARIVDRLNGCALVVQISGESLRSNGGGL